MEFINKLILLAPAIIIAMTVHELAHAWVANRMGDDTAKRLGRISLNPIRHLDRVGTLVFLVTAWFGFGFGWAKPVPVNYRRMKNIRLGFILVSAAGPLSNMLVVVVMGLLTMAALKLQWTWFFEYKLFNFVLMAAYVNGIFSFLNLIPLPPLDGSNIVIGVLPANLAFNYQKLGRYGFIILFALIALPMLARQMGQEFPDILGILVREPATSLINLCFPFKVF